jgi:hypothetical protein
MVALVTKYLNVFKGKRMVILLIKIAWYSNCLLGVKAHLPFGLLFHKNGKQGSIIRQ